jgi:hypothetical protein
VVGPTIPSGSAVFGEGVAVWLGGSHEKSLRPCTACSRNIRRHIRGIPRPDAEWRCAGRRRCYHRALCYQRTHRRLRIP